MKYYVPVCTLEDTYLLYYEAVLEEAESSDMLSGCGTSDGAIDWELVNHVCILKYFY